MQYESSMDDSDDGSSALLNDLDLSLEDSKPRISLKEQPQQAPPRSRSIGLSLFRKGRSRSDKSRNVTGRAASQVHSLNTMNSRRPGTPNNLADRTQIDYPRERSNGDNTIQSSVNEQSPKRTSSGISHLTDRYSLSSADSRSSQSSSTLCSSPSRRQSTFERRQSMSRRQSDCSDNYSRSRTQSTGTRVSSAGSSAMSTSLASDYSSFESFSHSSTISPVVDPETFLLRLKETVSTAAFSRAPTPDNLSTSGRISPFARKMTMSTSSGGAPKRATSSSPGPRSSTPTSFGEVASMFGLSAPPLHP